MVQRMVRGRTRYEAGAHGDSLRHVHRMTASQRSSDFWQGLMVSYNTIVCALVGTADL